jgi:hypothetical protein
VNALQTGSSKTNPYLKNFESLKSGRVKNSKFKQWRVLTERYTRNLSRDRKNLCLLMLQPIIIALLIIMVYNAAPIFNKSDLNPKDVKFSVNVTDPGSFQTYQDNTKDETKRRSRMSMCIAMMIFTTIWLGTSSSVREIVKELPIYRRERLINLQVVPYLMSKVSILLFICLLQTILFVALIHIGLGLPNFWPNVAAFFLVSLGGVMMGLAVSATVTNTDKAMSMTPVLLVPQIILSGALVQVSDVKPEILQKVFYLAISKWGYELVGGGICNINNRVVLQESLDAFKGDFSMHWWILILFIALLFVLSLFAVLRKDKLEI